jgi:hypothetical protein
MLVMGELGVAGLRGRKAYSRNLYAGIGRGADCEFGGLIVEMKNINSGRLRAIGYDARERELHVKLDNGDTLKYSGVGDDVWRRLSSSGAAWSYYRDNIEEEYSAQRVSGAAPAKRNPLDDLFG